jgi:hypothetical protein
MSQVELKRCYLHLEPVELTGELRAALNTTWKAPTGILLGQAFDGVVWGQIQEGQLTLATDDLLDVGALLRHDTLLNLRLFNREQELRLWRTEEGLQGCLVREATTGRLYEHHQDQAYELIRQPEASPVPAPFVVLHGLAGQCHAPPGQPVPRKLRVRHYLELEPETGLLRLAEHRLLCLEGEEILNATS